MNRASIGGFTLLEIMVTIAVMVVLLTLAIPSMQEVFKRNDVAAQNNELIALVHLARNEAIRRNPVGAQTVNVELDIDLTVPSWGGYVRPPGDDETAEGCPVGAIRCSAHQRVRMRAASAIIRFDNRGYSVDGDGNPTGMAIELVHRDCRSDRHARMVRVLPAGQVVSEEMPCAGGETDDD